MAAIDETCPEPPASQVRRRAGSFPFAGGAAPNCPFCHAYFGCDGAAAPNRAGSQLSRLLMDFTASRNFSRRCSAMSRRAIRIGITVTPSQRSQQRPLLTGQAL